DRGADSDEMLLLGGEGLDGHGLLRFQVFAGAAIVAAFDLMTDLGVERIRVSRRFPLTGTLNGGLLSVAAQDILSVAIEGTPSLKLLLEPGTRPMQPDLRRAQGSAEHLGDLTVGKLFAVAQREHRLLARGQSSQHLAYTTAHLLPDHLSFLRRLLEKLFGHLFIIRRQRV